MVGSPTVTATTDCGKLLPLGGPVIVASGIIGQCALALLFGGLVLVVGACALLLLYLAGVVRCPCIIMGSHISVRGVRVGCNGRRESTVGNGSI